MPSVFPELRFAARALARDRSFSLAALVTFALCVAANVAIFAVVQAVLLRPLPLPEPDRLVVLYNSYPKAGVERAGNSTPHFLERRENLHGVSGLAAWRERDTIVGEPSRSSRVSGGRVTPGFFDVLGVAPQLGRSFRSEEGEEGHENVAILSHGYWQQELGGDPAAIGRTLRVDGTALTIVGILPSAFAFAPAKEVRLWTPLVFRADDRAPDRRHSNNLNVVGRLAPGVSVAQLHSEVGALNAKSLETDPYRQPVIDAGFRTIVSSLTDDLTRDARSALWLLQGGALLVLVIGTVNLANLVLVRASARATEMAIRRVLGAGPGAIIRQVVAENLVLALIGGLAGLALGAALLPALQPLGLGELPRGDEARVDGVVAAIAMFAAALTGLVLAVPPLLQALFGKLGAALTVESRGGTTNRRQSRIREGLIVAQIALAFVLLTGAGLLTLSFARVLKIDPGFRAEQLHLAHVNLPRLNYATPETRRSYVQRLVRELAGIPGAMSVAVSTGAPFSGETDANVMTAEDYQAAPGESVQAPFSTAVAGEFFETYQIALREGRFLTTDDSDAEARVAVIDERFARRYWPNRSPIGRRIRQGTSDDTKAEVFTVVGVVAAVKQKDLAEAANVGAVYLPYRHNASPGLVVSLRTTQAAAAVATALQAAARRVDPEVPLFEVQTMSGRIANSLGARLTPMVLAGAFAVVALLLAAVGTYGVLAYTVAQRQREIGIRLALGARPDQVHALFLGLGARLFLIGLVCGGPLVWWLGGLMRSQLVGIEPTNPWVLAAGATFVGAVAIGAAVLPARRAAGISPLTALRSE